MKTSPANIYIIRHGEKHDDNDNLSPRGRSRASAFGFQFTEHIDFIFASKETKNSNRPIETISPFANLHKKKINSKVEDADFKELATLLKKKKYFGKSVVICWHHRQYSGIDQSIGW